MNKIESETDIAEGLAFLLKRDRRLRKVAAIAGPVPLRLRPAGFGGLARIIIGQQVSIASAEAIWNRFQAAFPECEPHHLDVASDAALAGLGCSAMKVRTLRATAAAFRDRRALDALAELPAGEAHRRLTAIRGIGPWTAEIYLLFCLGHADIFPAGDLALRKSVADAFGIAEPSIGEMAAIAVKWSPWRGVAARLFWAYYRARSRTVAMPAWIV